MARPLHKVVHLARVIINKWHRAGSYVSRFFLTLAVEFIQQLLVKVPSWLPRVVSFREVVPFNQVAATCPLIDL